MHVPRARRHRYGKLVGAFLLVTVLGGLAGCQGNPEPAPLPSPTTSPSPSPSPSVASAPPVLPNEARGTSAASARAFVRHYVDLVNHAMATGDVEGLSAVGEAIMQIV